MSQRTYAYIRVSTDQQTTDNQKLEILNKYPNLKENRFFSDTMSGSIIDRPNLNRLLDVVEAGDTVVFVKLDRLGRNSIEIQKLINLLTEKKVKIDCLQFPDLDLASPAGKMFIQVLAALAEMERNLIIERTKAGLARAKANGKTAGRPKTTPKTIQDIQKLKGEDKSQSMISKELGISLSTIKRNWKTPE